MSVQATMTDRQSLPVGVTLLDRDGQPLTELPEGAAIEFVSSNPDVVGVELHEDGMNATLTSGKVGTATVTVRATGLATPIPEDTISVSVTNSAPGSLNLTVGVPVAEPGTEGDGEDG